MNKNHSLRSIQIVIWFLILTTLIAFATSCSSTKRLVRSNYVESIDSITVVHQNDSVATSTKAKTAETLSNLDIDEDMEVQINIYDTDKPVDSFTGKPPLKQEINAKKKKQTNAKIKHNEVISDKDSTATSRRDTTAQYKWFAQKTSEDLEQKTKFIFPWWGIFGGLAVALLLIYISKKWRIFPRI